MMHQLINIEMDLFLLEILKEDKEMEMEDIIIKMDHVMKGIIFNNKLKILAK